MNLSSFAPSLARASRQLSLLSVAPCFRITKNAQARNAYGSLAQEIVCAALSLDPIPIDGRKTICFDAERSGHFFEIKSARAGSKVVIYDCRMSKERAAEVPLSYAILLHKVKKSNGTDLVQEFARCGLELLVLPACVVHEAALSCPLKRILSSSPDPRNGYQRAGYREGYRSVPTKSLKALCGALQQISFKLWNENFDIALYKLSALTPNP